jgi:hypothetical protein
MAHVFIALFFILLVKDPVDSFVRSREGSAYGLEHRYERVEASDSLRGEPSESSNSSSPLHPHSSARSTTMVTSSFFIYEDFTQPLIFASSSTVNISSCLHYMQFTNHIYLQPLTQCSTDFWHLTTFLVFVKMTMVGSWSKRRV